MLRFCHFQLVNNARIQQTGLSSIGSKACGGPTGFVAYSLKLNTTEFLTKLKNTQIIRKIQYEMGLFQLVTFLLPNKYRMCVEGTIDLLAIL
jgi:hypothetical protein